MEEATHFLVELANISMENDACVSNDRLLRIHEETQRDIETTLQTLVSIIIKGWPDYKVQVPL